MRITYDKNSFCIDGKRIWLVCGEMHYFRVPRKLWKKRMLQAKENGINCISTYMAWNIHEETPDIYDFSGDKDVAAYIKTASECGLYVILRPGPYICSEWDFGGLPAYLTTIENIEYRTNHFSYQQRYEKYFKQILPCLSLLDIEHNGNIILIQNENEHIMPNINGRTEYFNDINRIYRECGFNIPIINCNRMKEGSFCNMIECINTWDNPLEDIDDMRKLQPSVPSLITELWCGGCNAWNVSYADVAAGEVYRRVLLILAVGSQYTYYMWHGGTNFDFYGGRLQYRKDFHMITSYDLNAPLSEGGIETEKYYITGLVNSLALCVGARWCEMNHCVISENNTTTVTLSNSCTTINVTVSNKPSEKTNRYGASIKIKELEVCNNLVSLENLMPSYIDGNKIVLYGEIGQSGNVSINNIEKQILVIKERQSFYVDNMLIEVVSIDEILLMCKKNAQQSFKPLVWECTAENDPSNIIDWIDIKNPTGADCLGIHYGYIWYKFIIHSDCECRKSLVFPYSEDRCTLYFNNEICGIWGVGTDASFEGISVNLKNGDNVFYVLCDNLGRLNHSYKMGEPKGFFGMPHYGEMLKLKDETERFEKPLSYHEPNFIDWNPNCDICENYVHKYKFTVRKSTDIYLRMELNCSISVYINNKKFDDYQSPYQGYADCYIRKDMVLDGENIIEIVAYKKNQETTFRGIWLMQLNTIDNISLSYANWEKQDKKIQSNNCYPKWFSSKFCKVSPQKPLFIKFTDGEKGQLYFNKHNIGRVWAGVPQDTYYLPECWIEGNNEITYYSEGGKFVNACLTSEQKFRSNQVVAQNFDVV